MLTRLFAIAALLAALSAVAMGASSGEVAEPAPVGAPATEEGAEAPGSADAEEPTAAPCGEPPPGMVCVPGGSFVRGSDDGHGCEQSDQPRDRRPSDVPAGRVWVDTFYMDQTEVTVAAFAACIEAGACRDVGPRYQGFDRPQHPITAIAWSDAVAYCEFLGRRLPTEAEFELAARGHEGELNPWGNDPATCEVAVIRDERGRSCGESRRRGDPDVGVIAEVASRPAGRFGLYDMVGNVEEWVADWWSPDYEACGEACWGENPRGPCDGAEPCPGHRYRVVRGGSWYWGAEHATGTHRRRARPANDPPHHYGFRCAR